MKKNNEVNLAFRLWDQISQLESILWDRYGDEFLNLTIEQVEQVDRDPSQHDSQDVYDPF